MKTIDTKNHVRSGRPRVELPPRRGGAGQTALLGLTPARLGLTKILVPIDFSEESTEAIRYALPLAKEVGATITLLHVTDPITFPADYGYGPVVRQVSDKAGMKRARARLKRLGQRMIGPAMLGETIVLSGEACFEITEAGRAIEADLIIIGSHDSDGATSAVGSTAERVGWHAPCPVFVVRRKERSLAGLNHKELYADQTN
jgi:nucleotide-binding universal stress UspA family protein